MSTPVPSRRHLIPWQHADPNRPDYARPEHRLAIDDLDLIRDLLHGTRAMQEKGSYYVPSWPDEDVTVHRMRYTGEPLFAAFARILDASVGKMFASPPQVEWGPNEATLRPHWDNIDGAGTKGDVALRWFSRDALADGFAGILVDHPVAPEGTPVSRLTERSLNLRPTWAFYTRRHILSWRTAVLDNVETLTQVTLYEEGTEDSGAFGVEVVHRYRVLMLVNGVAGFTVFRKRENTNGAGEHFEIEASGIFKDIAGRPLPFIPFAVAYTGPHPVPFSATPPLLPVAHANLAHWRTACELTFGRSWSAVEQMVVVGELHRGTDGNPVKIKKGWTEVIQVQAGGDVKHIGPSGTALEQLVKGKTEKEQEMAAMGLAFLSRETRAAETAESKRIDASAQDATLSTSAQGVEDAINLAWEYHGAFLGLPKAAVPTLTFNRDYDQTAMDAQTMVAYVTAVEKAGLSPRVMLDAWLQGGRIAAGTDLDALESEMVAGMEAAADARAVAAEAQADALNEAQPVPAE
jgi:hypothetical protein